MPRTGFVRSFLLSALAAGLICGSSAVLAGPIVSLGTALSFAVLAGSTVTNTATPTILNGDLGVWPGTAITGFPPGIVNGTQYAGGTATGVSGTAEGDLTTAYNNLLGLDGQSAVGLCDGSATNLSGSDLGTVGPLLPGVYCFTSSAQLTGTLVLNEQGQADPEFVFQIGSALTTASNSAVTEINGGTDNNIFWQIGSSATLGTGTQFLGNIVALTSITLNTGADISCGAALARNGAVTLDNNTITNTSLCQTGTNPSPVPEPSTLTALGIALFALIGIGWRRSAAAVSLV